jgi:hypothetical protein
MIITRSVVFVHGLLVNAELRRVDQFPLAPFGLIVKAGRRPARRAHGPVMAKTYPGICTLVKRIFASWLNVGPANSLSLNSLRAIGYATPRSVMLGEVDAVGVRVDGDRLVRVPAEELERHRVLVRLPVRRVDLEDVAVVLLEHAVRPLLRLLAGQPGVPRG